MSTRGLMEISQHNQMVEPVHGSKIESIAQQHSPFSVIIKSVQVVERPDNRMYSSGDYEAMALVKLMLHEGNFQLKSMLCVKSLQGAASFR